MRLKGADIKRFLRRLLFRPKAIFYCLWFGGLHWTMYEEKCHYIGMTYFEHLCLNIESAWLYLTCNISMTDLLFEIKTNKL